MKQVTNIFTSFELTEKERQEGSLLTQMQEVVLQNQLAQVATEKVNLVFDPLNVQDFQMQTAYKQGQIDLLTYILAESEATKLVIAQNANNSLDQNKEY